MAASSPTGSTSSTSSAAPVKPTSQPSVAASSHTASPKHVGVTAETRGSPHSSMAAFLGGEDLFAMTAAPTSFTANPATAATNLSYPPSVNPFAPAPTMMVGSAWGSPAFIGKYFF